jgi:proline iminopeptidase
MRLRYWILIAVAALVAGGGWLAYRWITGPMYHPGDVRAGRHLREPLAPPAQSAAAEAMWRVAPDIELYHFAQGTGEPILTIPGGPGYVFTEPWKANAGLGASYRLHYYHPRGSGRSTRPYARIAGNPYQAVAPLEATLGLGAQIADIERIRRILGRDRLILAGHSFGALTAALYAAEFPERVKALVLISPANLAQLPNPDGNAFPLIRAHLPLDRVAEFDRFTAAYFDFGSNLKKSEAELAALQQRFGEFYLAACPGCLQAQPAQPPATLGGFMAQAVYLSLGQRHDYRDALRRVTVPVLVIHGDQDLQPASSSRAFAELFPNHRMVTVAGASHFAFEERPAEFASVVQQFLARP